MKVVVFGSSGFLGSHVADALTNDGYEVVLFDITKSKYMNKDQKMILGDIKDLKAIQDTVHEAKYVYHFAGVADLKEAQDDPINTVKNNILGTTNILEACKREKVERFIFASSVYVYSELGSFYRSSKQSSELLIENYADVYNLDYTILRYGSLYGRRANDFNFIHNAIKQALLEGKIVRKGDGNDIRDYINVTDAAQVSVDILTDKYKNSHVMISGTQTMKTKEILGMIREMFQNEIEIQFTEGKYEGHYEITPYSFKPRLAKRYTLLNYVDLGQGILDCIYNQYKEYSNSSKDIKIDFEIPGAVNYQDHNNR